MFEITFFIDFLKIKDVRVKKIDYSDFLEIQKENFSREEVKHLSFSISEWLLQITLLKGKTIRTI